MPSMYSPSASGLGIEPDAVICEHEATEPFDAAELPPEARAAVANEINTDETRLEVEYLPDGRVKLHATSFVGIVALPNGPTIEIRPKVPDADLLGLIQYANGIEARTIEETTAISAGRTFIDALATLFETELTAAIEHGLHKEYRRQADTTDHVRGRVDVQRQLQRQGPLPTEFECEYDELTVDTTLNRAVLYATTLLEQLVRDATVSKALNRHQQRLRRRVTLTPIRPITLEGIELSRLTAHYEDLLRLTKLVLRNIYIDELRAAERPSYALLVDMNAVFEAVVERGVSEAIGSQEGWSVQTQASSDRLVSGGARPIRIRPDVVMTRYGTDRFVGDAKWKIDEPEANNREPSPDDIYQVVSYQVAHETQGVLFYPEQAGRVKSVYDVHRMDSLTVVEVPVRAGAETGLADAIESEVSTHLLDH